MIEYSVILKRHPGSGRPDVCIFRDEDREVAIRAMRDYCKKFGFTVADSDGRFTICDILLVEKEPVYGAPVLSVLSYIDLFDETDNRRSEGEVMSDGGDA